MESEVILENLYLRVESSNSVKACLEGKSDTIHHLSVNDIKVTAKHDIAKALADTFSYNSSSVFCTDTFLSLKIKLKYTPFSSLEITSYFVLKSCDTLHRSCDIAVGPEKIHNQFLKHLPESSLLILLNIFNKIWTIGCFPSGWRKAIIILISKPGKDPLSPSSYCPIALTSCICKTMVRMINRKLI